MDNYTDVLLSSPLFEGLAAHELQAALVCLDAAERFYVKGETVIRTGDSSGAVGVVLSGTLHIIREDYFGSRVIISLIEAGDLFGESFAFAGEPCNVSVTAASDCRILFTSCGKIIAPCLDACGYHTRIISNMLRVLAGKNVFLTRKLEHVTRHSTREKIMSYLSEQASEKGSRRFSIPLNRQQMADYLAVERSAMSAEISRMKRDGVIDYSRNEFELL